MCFQVEYIKLMQIEPQSQKRNYYTFIPVDGTVISKWMLKIKFGDEKKIFVLEKNKKYEFVAELNKTWMNRSSFVPLVVKKYIIEIKTADKDLAGTDSNVAICLSGTKGDTCKW